MQIIMMNQIRFYVARNGKKPFVHWIESIKDVKARYRIKERLDRLRLGNFGDHKFVSEGVYELRLDFGSGYRIYFGKEGNKIILLLCGGNKASQRKDIKKAIVYWKDYLSR